MGPIWWCYERCKIVVLSDPDDTFEWNAQGTAKTLANRLKSRWGHHNQVALYVGIGNWEAKQGSERPLNHLSSTAVIPARFLKRGRCAKFVLNVVRIHENL